MILNLFLCLVLAFGLADKLPRLKSGRVPFSSRVSRSHPKGKFRVNLSLSQTENVVLDLEPNGNLLSDDYQEVDVSAAGKKTVLRRGADMQVCWFKGKIVGEEASSVLVSDCGSGFQGMIKTGNGRNYIAASVGEDRDDVAVYPSEDEEVKPGTCGVTSNQQHSHDAETTVFRRPSGQAVPGRRLLDFSTTVNVVEVAIVSDKLYIQAQGGAFGRNLTALGERNIAILAIVQAIYEATSFALPTTVKLKAQYFFSSGDPYSMVVDGNGEVDPAVLLDNVRTWGLTLPFYDHVHLLTYYDLQATVVGLAYVSAACGSFRFGESMATSSVTQVADTVAHELGHSLGMYHDGTSGGNQPDNSACPSTGSVMASVISCPTSGLCPMSSCSISNKNAYAATVNCLYNWTDPSCSDGVMGGDETGIDCGGSCPACANGCSVNNGGCAQTCTPVGVTYVCSCADPMYLDPVTGTDCLQDVDQCLSSPCEETCANTIGPGDSFVCGCVPPKSLSLLDSRSCLSPSCFDRRRNQDEVMIDCGGVCSRSCSCLQSIAGAQYYYDRGIKLTGAQWRTFNNSNVYQLVKYGVPVRYLYQSPATQWNYDIDLDTNGYYGVAYQSSVLPYSGQWQIYDGNQQFVAQTITFSTCAYSVSTCGNGVLDAGEECESCLVFSGGSCVQENPCCDSSCLAPSLEATPCQVDGQMGSCWKGSCITRAASCEVVASIMACWGPGPGCLNLTGGQNCDGVAQQTTFSASVCGADLFCYLDCEKTTLGGVGLTRGFPCSGLNSDGRYTSVCDGGVQGTGENSVCVLVSSLIDYSTAHVTSSPTTPQPTTRAPSLSPTTRSPTTLSPTTRSPTTRSPTTRAPTPSSPTTRSPTTGSPTTRSPTTRAPTPSSPTTRSPTTGSPTTRSPTTRSPTTRAPTPSSPTTRSPTTRSPTTRSPTTRVPTTRAPTPSSPTTRSPTTGSPTTRSPTTRVPTTRAPTPSPTTRSPTTRSPTTRSPTTRVPTTRAPTPSSPTTRSPTTRSPTTRSPTTRVPTTRAPTPSSPTTRSPTTGSPTTRSPTTRSPISSSPTTRSPSTGSPTTRSPSTFNPTTRSPTTNNPSTTSPTSSSPTSRSPTTQKPSTAPTGMPSVVPTRVPTAAPTLSPLTLSPSRPTTRFPTTKPTRPLPTLRPSRLPTFRPTRRPSTLRPSRRPPTSRPSRFPTTSRPTRLPTSKPTRRPPTSRPTRPTTLAPSIVI